MLILPKKTEHYELKKYKNFLKAYIKIEKTIRKFSDVETE